MKPGGFKRFCRRCAIGLGVVLAILALFLLEEHIRGRIELNAWMKEMRARGEKFTIAELTPPPTPPEKNGALIWMNASFMAGRLVPDKIPSAMRPVAPRKAVAMVARPAWTLPSGKAVAFSTNDVTALWRTNSPVQSRKGGEDREPMLITREDLAAEIAANSNVFAQVRAALECPVLDHGLQYSLAFALRLPHLAHEKVAAQWLRAASLSALYETNCGASLQNLVALAALVHGKTNELLLISQLVRIAILHLGVAAVWEALQAGCWTDEHLARLQEAWQPDDWTTTIARSLEMERAMGSDLIKRCNSDLSFAKDLLQIEFEKISLELPADFEGALEPTVALFKNVIPAFKLFVYVPAWRFAWKDQDELRLLKLWQAPIDAARKQSSSPDWSKHSLISTEMPHEEFRFEAPERGEGMNFWDRTRYLCSSFISGTDGTNVRTCVAAQTSCELAATAIGLRRWEVRHGKLPNSLGELVPDILSSVPIDPMDGKPLRYRRNADGAFLLYSVGVDGKDDGGTALPPKSDTRLGFLTGRDIVWPQRASPEEIAEFEKKR